ncbi:hypothetical protein JOF53_005447 [Crossiella equi]|uniref:Uncharacterized protein n=1 Tax=Crossiella equi TaxID=130796 RepID=A0ABS5ALM7_9PSEU|nr:hypothetical protein [Crossiella equi]MBP2476575.1 hypothetical protein [Crossiella equi]
MGAVILVGLAALMIHWWRGAGMQPTMTREQAVERLDTHLRAAMAVLPEGATFEKGFSNVTRCDLPSDSGPKGRVSAGTTYKILGVAMTDFQAVFERFKGHWARDGYILLEDTRPKSWFLRVQSTPEEFRMSLQGNDQGGLFLLGSSPCVWPDGTPS